MVVGACEIECIIFECNSLKEKRHVIKSVIQRLQSRFNISIAEVGENDKWQKSIIGFSAVSNSSKQIDSIASSVINFIDNDERIEIININTDIY
ncbi:conserved protein of unknown function [Tepidibacter aestuarii]|nr:conserved protein of unknown function [Tepidibacter aestuarii]